MFLSLFGQKFFFSFDFQKKKKKNKAAKPVFHKQFVFFEAIVPENQNNVSNCLLTSWKHKVGSQKNRAVGFSISCRERVARRICL